MQEIEQNTSIFDNCFIGTYLQSIAPAPKNAACHTYIHQGATILQQLIPNKARILHPIVIKGGKKKHVDVFVIKPGDTQYKHVEKHT